MKKVVVLTTGGTIASVKNDSNGLFTSGALPGEQLIDREKIDSAVSVEVASIFQVPSNAMSFDHLLTLRDKILEYFSDPDVAGITVTHGTDTLEESSYFLDLVINDPRPVVLTGSQRATFEEGTDSYANIRDAVTAAACPDCRDMGVMVLFNEYLFSAKYVKKMHAYNVHAFTSFGTGYLGYVDKGKVYMIHRPVRRESHEIKQDLPRVEIIKACLDGDGGLISCAADLGLQGLIIEGVGRGHVTPKVAQAVAKAVEKGIFVVITTACEQGRVHPVYDFKGGVVDLKSKGAITGHDYDSKKARIKLIVLLASGIESKDDLQQAFLF
ncbi:asparaginase [Desulfospira joergensenii]|uniref:asparaginase n=1 Tax=Desulfospira joergensenii TaxID=53329 RepID=UPI0003B4BF11|nr:asparaginase [Desulfospira joergensenii]